MMVKLVPRTNVMRDHKLQYHKSGKYVCTICDQVINFVYTSGMNDPLNVPVSQIFDSPLTEKTS